jgi:2,3-bisphosphoglycerate-independent phosphoglycerate mutase
MDLNFDKVVLVVLDGFGVASAAPGNAITRQGMPVFDDLVNNYPSVTLQAAGPNVGLPWGEPGNSEVGHMCLGAGRIVMQDLPRIDKAIGDGEFYANPAFLGAMEHVKKNDSALHLIGLIGDGGVHASQLHLYSLLSLAEDIGVKTVYLHCITDGRDSPRDAGVQKIKEIEKKLVETGVGKIVSVTGRFYAMDRAKHWDLTEAAYKAYTLGEGALVDNPLQALETYYDQSTYDETIPPTLIMQADGKAATVKDNDAVIIFNFRADRAIQITQAFADPSLTGFAGKYAQLQNLYITTMTSYEKNLPVQVAFPRLRVVNGLSEVLSKSGKRQYHCSEVEKYPHVTYFFSNGKEEPNNGEVWEKVSSSSQYQDRYQNVPQMASFELTQKLIEKFKEHYDFYLVNYANPDMVGHTGNLAASMRAVKAVDECLGQIVKFALESKKLLVLVTADHGNVEGVHNVMTGKVSTSHSTNPVPFIVIGAGLKLKKPRTRGYLYLPTRVPEGLLTDVAPTVLQLFEISQPQEMTGVSLLKKFAAQIIGEEKVEKQKFVTGE